WRGFQFGSEFKDARAKCIESRIVPRTRQFPWPWLFAKIEKFHPIIHTNRTAFADILTTRDGDNCFNLFGEIGDAFVVYRIDQDVAVTQNKRTILDEIAGKIDNATCSILSWLACIL